MNGKITIDNELIFHINDDSENGIGWHPAGKLEDVKTNWSIYSADAQELYDTKISELTGE